jgi:Ca2+-binding EF-hand superfamily protein
MMIMNTRTKALIAGALFASTGALAFAGPSYAQEAQSNPDPLQLAGVRHGDSVDGMRRHGKRGRHGGPGMKLMESFDTNQDGKLTQAEIDAARADRLAKFDANKDGNLSLEEYQDLWLDAMREHMVDRFQQLDADGDAVVTVDEFGKPFANMVERRDRNGDGELSAADLRRRHHDKERDDEDKDKD